MDPLSKNIFELVSMLEGTWKFPSVFLKDIYLFLRYMCNSEYEKLRHCRDICHAQVVK